MATQGGIISDRAALLVTDDLNVVHSMMKVAGGSVQYANEGWMNLSANRIIIKHSTRQAESVYKFFYNGGQGAMLSHPFPVERLRYLQSGQSIRGISPDSSGELSAIACLEERLMLSQNHPLIRWKLYGVKSRIATGN